LDPEQIGIRMIEEQAPLRVCQETIYRYIYAKEGMREDLWWNLPTHRVARRPRRMRKRREPKFLRDVSILFRPDDVAHRRQLGHREGDLMLFKQKLGQTNVTTLVERVSRFTVVLKNPNRRTKPVMPCPAGDCAAICREGQDHQGHERSASHRTPFDHL
jgi:IS30 family transposase